MFRKIILLSFLLSSAIIVFAQKQSKQKTAAEQKQVELFTMLDGKKVFYNEVGAPLPPTLNIWRRDNVFLTNETLKNDANLIIMLFNPTCEHCEIMAKTFKDNIDLFKKTNLVLVAANGMESYLDFFIKNTGTELVSKMQISTDSSGFINQTFLYKTLPQINVYNKERKLEKIFFGDVSIDILKPYIE